MKKILPLFLMALLTSALAYAADVTFDFVSLYGDATVQPATQLQKDGITVSFAKGNSGTEPAYFVSSNGNDKEMRLYGGSATAPAGNSMTITSSTAITSITIDAASASKPTTLAELSADSGTITVDSDRNATWTGNATSVTISVVRPSSGAGQYRFKAMTVTTGGSGEITVAKPTFSPAAGTFYVPVNVELKCATAGASIYYTLDGSTPTVQSTAYTAAITISSNTTVKAIAALDGKTSDVAEAAYVFESATPVVDIAAYQAVDDETMVVFQNSVTALKQSGNRLFIKDASGYALVYGSIGQTYSEGDVIPAGFAGKKTTYGGEPELASPSGFQAASSNVAVEPELIQAADVSHDYFGHLVLIKGAKFDYTTTSSGAKNMSTITDASGSAVAYNQLGFNTANFDYDKTYNVTAIIGSYLKSGETTVTYQVFPVKAEDVEGGGGGGETTDGVTVAEVYSLADNAAVTFKNDLVVLAVAGDKNTYVKDDTGAMLIYGTTGQSYKAGDVIPAGAGGVKTTYNNLVEVQNPTGFAAAKGSSTVTPEEKTLSEISTALMNHLVIIKGVTFSGTSVTDGTTTLVTYNKPFGVATPDDDRKYNVTAIVSVFKNDIQLLPVTIVDEAGGGVSVPEVANVTELYGKDKGVTYKITGDLVAVYQNDKYLYVKSGSTMALVYGALDATFTNGDVIRDAEASWTEFNGAKQLTPVVSTFVKVATTTPVEPEEIAFEEIGTDMAHAYVIATEATITTSEDKFYVNDGTEDIQLYDQFFRDATIIPAETEGKTYTVKGFIANYKGTLELLPIEIKDNAGEETRIEDVNGDGKVNAADVNVVIAEILAHPDGDGNKKYDVNNDDKVNAADANVILAYILANPE